MVDNLFPADAVAGAPSYSGRMLRQAQGAFLAGATSARPLGARSGVRPGTPSTTVTATSAEWTCQAFGGVADVMTAGESGPYSFAFDAVDTGAVTAAHATLPRVDIVYVAVEDPAEGIGTVPLVERRYLAGTAAASPVAPSIPVGERGFVIANLNVPASGGGSPSVTWVAPEMAAAGGIVRVRNQSELDAYRPPDGHSAYRLDTSGAYLRRSGAWVERSLIHGEWTYAIGSVANSSAVNPGTLTAVSAATSPNAAAVFTAGVGKVTVGPAGVYMVTIAFHVGVTSAQISGRTFVDFQANGNTYRSAQVGDEYLSVSGEVFVPAGADITFNIFQTSGAARAVDGRIAISYRGGV